MKQAVLTLAIADGKCAQVPALPNPAASDPVALGWMQGSPLAPQLQHAAFSVTKF